jgi:hypothetical protein
LFVFVVGISPMPTLTLLSMSVIGAPFTDASP